MRYDEVRRRFERYRPRVGLLARLRLAFKLFWCGLRLKNYRAWLTGYRFNGVLKPFECDFHEKHAEWKREFMEEHGLRPCRNMHVVCLAPLVVRLEFEMDESRAWHVCEEHAMQLLGKGVR